LQGILDGAALQRETACNFKVAPSISVSGFAVAFGNVQRDRLRSTQEGVLGVAMVLQRFIDVRYTSSFAYSNPIFCPSIPIPIPTPTPSEPDLGSNFKTRIADQLQCKKPKDGIKRFVP
jgi:hypothetical protein